MDVLVEQCEPLRVAFVRHVGPYQECGAGWEKLAKFAAQQGWSSTDVLHIGVGHDNPEITAADKLRYDACMTVNDRFQATGEIGVQELPGGEHAVMIHRGPYENLSGTYRQFFREWVPNSGREKRPGPCYEIYVNDWKTTPPENLLTEIHVPLKT